MHVIRQMLKLLGISDRVSYCGTASFPVENCDKPEIVLSGFELESQKAMEQGAEVIVLGCTGMTGFAVELQKRLGVPVVDPSVCTLKFAELLVTMNLSHSSLTIPSPDLCGARCVMKWPETLNEYPLCFHGFIPVSDAESMSKLQGLTVPW